MSYGMTGAVTGATVTGLTSPTYTLSADTAIDSNARQSVVTALGGTQTGVNAHSVSSPFSVTVTRPRSLNQLGKANLNGFIPNVGRNTYRILVRKGVTVAAGQPYSIALARTEVEIPSGSEVYDQPNVKAMISFYAGFLNTNANGLAQTTADAVL
jgi:biotin carboxyl carrier protein